jgi:hypothetical protein
LKVSAVQTQPHASIGDIPIAAHLLYLQPHSQLALTRPHVTLRDVTCDGTVMAETAEFCGCDGVMDRIAFIFCSAENGERSCA